MKLCLQGDMVVLAQEGMGCNFAFLYTESLKKKVISPDKLPLQHWADFAMRQNEVVVSGRSRQVLEDRTLHALRVYSLLPEESRARLIHHWAPPSLVFC